MRRTTNCWFITWQEFTHVTRTDTFLGERESMSWFNMVSKVASHERVIPSAVSGLYGILLFSSCRSLSSSTVYASSSSVIIRASPPFFFTVSFSHPKLSSPLRRNLFESFCRGFQAVQPFSFLRRRGSPLSLSLSLSLTVRLSLPLFFFVHDDDEARWR